MARFFLAGLVGVWYTAGRTAALALSRVPALRSRRCADTKLLATTTRAPETTTFFAAAAAKEEEEEEESTVSWRTLGVKARFASALEEMGALRPTAVQAKAVPVLLEGRDAALHAPTGSGKTLAYLVPLLSAVDASRQTTQAVVIVPTRELGLQVSAVARRLARRAFGGDRRRSISVMSLLSGSKLRRQRTWAWASPPHVVVGEAQPVASMMALGGLKADLTKRISFAVVDEVDLFFEDDAYVNAKDAIHRILTTTQSRPRQTVFATATITQPRYFVASKLADWCVDGASPEYLAVQPRTLAPGLSHFVAEFETLSKRLTVARRVLRTLEPKTRFGPVLVFFAEKRRSVLRDFAQAFRDVDGYAVAVLDETDDLESRRKAVDAVRRDQVDVLLATDLAARGLDLPNLLVILNFDAPRNAVSYLHRAGRAGRCGAPGAVVSVVHAKERFAFDRISASYFNLPLHDFFHVPADDDDDDDHPLSALPSRAAFRKERGMTTPPSS